VDWVEPNFEQDVAKTSACIIMYCCYKFTSRFIPTDLFIVVSAILDLAGLTCRSTVATMAQRSRMQPVVHPRVA
jgi:hypothetical protein